MEFEQSFQAPMPVGPVERLLPALELDVMKVLWRRGDSSVAQVQQGLKPDRELAYTTVMTVLDRLHRKGAVSRIKDGRSFIYRTELSRDRALKLSLERLLRDFFGNSKEELVAHLTGELPRMIEQKTKGRSFDSSLL
jgi:predicted transcriptional regulator